MAIQEELWKHDAKKSKAVLDYCWDSVSIDAAILHENLPHLKGQAYGGYDCVIKLHLNNFRPHLEIKLDRTNGFLLENLHEGFSHLNLMDTRDEAISILLTQDCIKQIRLLVVSQEFSENDSLQIQERGGELSQTTREEICHSIEAGLQPTILEIDYTEEGTVYKNLLPNPPPWAARFGESITHNEMLRFIINGDEKTLHQIKHAANIIVEREHALDKFQKTLCPVNFELETFNARPLPQAEIFYKRTCSFTNPREYVTAMYAGVRTDREDEIMKIEAYESDVKTLVLVDTTGDIRGNSFFGLITAPTKEECRLQCGDTMTIQFVGRNYDSDGCMPWRATIIEPARITRRGMLPLLVYRGVDASTGAIDSTTPDTINPKDMSAQDLHRAVQKSDGNEVEITIVDQDSTHKRIAAAYEFIGNIENEVDASAFNRRLAAVLVGRRPDQLVVKDLYQHIRTEMNDPMAVMSRLNSQQQVAVQSSRRLRGGLQIIQGPPGTGKSFLLQQMITPFLLAERHTIVFVSTPTNHGADDLARDIRSALDVSKREHPNIKSRYVLRLFSPKTERAICRSQYDYAPGPQLQKAGSASTDVRNGVDDTLRELSEQVRAVEMRKFEGVKDMRVQDITYSVGYMILCITGVVPNTEFQEPNENRYQSFRAIYDKWRAKKQLGNDEFMGWQRQYDELFLQTLAGASVVVSTTAGISASYLLNHVQHEVVAVFLDENAHEREDALAPLLAAPFTLDPCIVIVGDQEQLEPQVDTAQKTSYAPVLNAFAPQLQMSFMTRMVKLGMEYTMLTEQYRMVEEIAELPSKLTYENKLINATSTALVNRPVAVKFRELATLRTGQPCNRMLINIAPSTTNETITNETGSKGNECFVGVVSKFLNNLHSIFPSDTTFAILTPYLHQRSLYNRMKQNFTRLNHPLSQSITVSSFQEFEKLTIGTFDGSQGRQFDIVIIDLPVDENIGFLHDKRRLNVAISRARNGFILVCDRKTIEKARGEAIYLRALLKEFEGKTWNVAA